MNILGFAAIVFGCMLVAPFIVGLLLVAVIVIAGYMAGVISAIVEAAADASEEFSKKRVAGESITYYACKEDK